MFWRTESRLLARAQRGDREAFRALYRGLFPKVAGFVGRRVRPSQDAEDVVSFVFERLVEQLDALDPRRGATGFVLQVARNAIIDRQRTRHPLEAIDPGLRDAAADPLDLALEHEELARLGEALRTLPPSDRELIALRCADGLKHSEIAAVLGLSEDAVKQRFSRALKSLKAAHEAI